MFLIFRFSPEPDAAHVVSAARALHGWVLVPGADAAWGPIIRVWTHVEPRSIRHCPDVQSERPDLSYLANTAAAKSCEVTHRVPLTKKSPPQLRPGSKLLLCLLSGRAVLHRFGVPSTPRARSRHRHRAIRRRCCFRDSHSAPPPP